MKPYPLHSQSAGRRAGVPGILVSTVFSTLVGTLLMLAAPLAHAQYKYIGPDGRVTYSDQPPPANARGVEPLNLGAAPSSAGLSFDLQQAMSKFPVTLYTSSKCDPCAEARTFLRQRGVPFAEKTVNSNEDINAFKNVSADLTVPVITIGSQKQIGFNGAAVASLLDNAGYPSTSKLPRDYKAPEAGSLAPPAKKDAAKKDDAAPTPTPATPSAAPKSNAPPGFRF